MRIFLASLLYGALMLSGQSLAGRRAPSFSLPDSNQVQHDILDYRGKWLLLTFTTTVNCQRCAQLSRELDKLQSPKVAVLSVMLSPPENANTAARYTAENKLTSPIVFDQSHLPARPSCPGPLI